MLFNSLSFLLFLPVVFFIYWYLFNKNYKSQNITLLIASYFFYACWDWRFMFLLLFSTLLDYTTGIKISESNNQTIKKTWFWLSIIINLGFLMLFKYYNFFITEFTSAFSQIGIQLNASTLNIILPVGISFYTFHGLSYVIDIYKDRIKAEKNVIDYAVFVSFFPLLVAGPIERATHLLPQIQKKREFNYALAVDGLRQMLWGFFKKIVVADQCAEFANLIFNNSDNYSGLTLLLGALFFTFQIYGDFSGYSDIALGTAKLFGIHLLKNFSFPYFSRDIAEFWRRWHISLSTWFRDYLYIPLGGSRGNLWQTIRNTFIIFIVSGFWHGANWTFIFWGALHAIYIIPSIVLNKNRNNLDIVAKGKILPSFKETYSMLITFCLTVIAWIFFRATNIQQAFKFINDMMLGFFSKTSFTKTLDFVYSKSGFYIFLWIFLFMLIEWIGRENNYAIEMVEKRINRLSRWFLYITLMILIIFFAGSQTEFIYFQF